MFGHNSRSMKDRDMKPTPFCSLNSAETFISGVKRLSMAASASKLRQKMTRPLKMVKKAEIQSTAHNFRNINLILFM